MLDISREIRQVQEATFGIETRSPVGDAIEKIERYLSNGGYGSHIINTEFCDFAVSQISGSSTDYCLMINPPSS